jgi:hypothetical protein
MQQQTTFNFGLTKIFYFIYRTLSMRQKTKNYRIKGSNAGKKFFIFLFSKSRTHMGLVCAKNASKKFSRLGTFNVVISLKHITSVPMNRDFKINLKVPKREIFVTELIILSHPIWIGDLRTKAKN